jgi:putative tryptophan/tyrosine transport system substrate-binding protein
MDRRTFLGTLAGGLLAAPLASEAQRSTSYARVGFLGAESPSTSQHLVDAFRQAMREHGYVDGQNMTIEERWAEGRSAEPVNKNETVGPRV